MGQQSCSRTRVPVWLALLLGCILGRPAVADELRLDARALFEKAVSRDLRLSAGGTALELETGELYEDDGPAAGYSYLPNEEKLSSSTWIKKELLIARPQAKKATLLVGSGGALQAVINGKAQELKQEGKVGNYWEAYSFPPQVLRAGKNEIVLHGQGKVWIARAEDFAAGSRTRTQHPNRSARSTDGGKTWDFDRLGSAGDIDGEYYVRIFLDQHRSLGTLTLPVIDAGNLTHQAIAAPVMSVGPIRIAVQAEPGKAGRLAVRVRSGSTLVPHDKTWSAWQDLGMTGGALEKPAGRFVQVAIELATDDPLQTPQLKELLITAIPKRSGEWTRNLKVLELHNEEIVRTSIPFQYEPFDHPQLKTLREQYRLDEVAKGAKGELDLAARLAGWSAKQWDQGHLKDIYPAWDALDILKPHTDGKPVGGFCQQYNLVLLQACESFGLVGRPVSLGPGNHAAQIRGGHEVIELWSNEHKKWIYLDGNTAWYAVDAATKVPLSLWELRERQLQALQGTAFKPIQIVHIAETKHAWKGLDAWPPFAELRLIPRSNFLEEKAPVPLNQGMRGWFWTGHHVWSDAAVPAAPLYAHRVGNRRQWEWTLNQAHLMLEATDAPGEFRVHLDTETPGFGTFLADIDDREKQPITSGFTWKLHSGKNRLSVRPRNSAGREGIPSRIVVEYP